MKLPHVTEPVQCAKCHKGRWKFTSCGCTYRNVHDPSSEYRIPFHDETGMFAKCLDCDDILMASLKHAKPQRCQWCKRHHIEKMRRERRAKLRAWASA